MAVATRAAARVRERPRTVWTAYLWILPAFVPVLLFILYPVVHSIWLSFYNVFLLRPRPLAFQGLRNYEELITAEKDILPITIQTVEWMVVVVAGSMLVGFVFAIGLNQRFRWRTLVRALIFVPWVLPEVVVAAIWKYMLDGANGIVNEFLVRIGVLQQYHPFLADPATSLASGMFVQIWRTYPFITIMLLAGLQTIPQEIYEAARVDGASRWQSLLHITIPQLRFPLSITSLTAAIWTVNSFSILWVLTEGGPLNSSTTIPIEVYKIAWQYYRFSRGAALSVLLFLAILVLAIWYVRTLRLTQRAEEA